MGTWEFEIVEIQKTKSPVPEHKGNWYQYTIANRITQITGTRRGSRDEVISFVKSSLNRLNTRHKAVSFSKS